MKTEGFMHDTDIVRAYYDADAEMEWNRLDKHPVEFELTKRFLSRHINPGSRVLDVGGGPGRYALWLAQRGCRVTLADLSQANVDFALTKATEASLALRGLRADARNLSALAGETFDHVLLMGPLYHLTDAEDRKQAVREALALLAPVGTLAASFISSFGGVLYSMRDEPDAILNPDLAEHFAIAARDEPYSGMAFTQAYFARRQDILPFMDGFGLEKLHFLSAEGMLSPYEANLQAQPPAVLAAWIDYAEQLCERQDILSFAEHYLYIGRKPI